METGIMQTLASFGITGVFAIMWWSERGDRQKALETARRAVDDRDQLLRVVDANTKAMTRLSDIIERGIEQDSANK